MSVHSVHINTADLAILRHLLKKLKTPWVLVRKRTIPTE
jgi:hypothetical protein